MKEILNWFEQAERDLLSARHALVSRDYYLVSFLSHQVVEKALKALYIKEFKELIKTHDLALLSRKLSLPEELITLCIDLNPVYLETRYPDASGSSPAYRYSLDDAETDLNNAKKVIKWIKTRL